MFLFLTSCGSSVEHQKRMPIICQRKKRRRGKSRRRRWTYLDLVFYSSRLSTTTISANRLTIACRTRIVFFLTSWSSFDTRLWTRQTDEAWDLYHALEKQPIKIQDSCCLLHGVTPNLWIVRRTHDHCIFYVMI